MTGSNLTTIIEDRWTGSSSRGLWQDMLFVFLFALAARLLAVPFTTIDSADSAARVWLGWQWLDYPHLIVEGVWGPLHFYLIGAVLYFWPDPVAAPIALHILIGAITPVVVYLFVDEIFEDRRLAVFSGIAFAFYPTAIATSVLPTSETPFCLFLALSLLFLARARNRIAGIVDPLLAGIMIGLASMLRYEAWLLMPFLTLLLIVRPKQAALFLIPALIHPLMWMTGNYLAHGDPFYSISWASNWERNAMGNAAEASLSNVFTAVSSLVLITERGLTLPLSLIALAGLVGSLVHRKHVRIWIIPPAGLFLLFVGAATGGSLLVKWQYTVTYGLLLMPFVAASIYVIGADRWSVGRFSAGVCGIVFLMVISMVEPLWQSVPGGGRISATAAPSFSTHRQATEILALVDDGLTPEFEALVTDFYGWLPTHYVALHSKLHPDQICTSGGAPNVPLDVKGFREFFQENPKGILITRESGRLSALLQEQEDRLLAFEGLTLQIEPLGEVPFPGNESKPGAPVNVAKYTILQRAEHATRNPGANERCAPSCVVDLCRRY